MPADANSPDRYAALQARIDAARQRLADSNKMEWAEVGHILEGISDELNEVGEHDHPKHDETYARLHTRLDEVHAKLDDPRPTE
jgi:hypothetical protein